MFATKPSNVSAGSTHRSKGDTRVDIDLGATRSLASGSHKSSTGSAGVSRRSKGDTRPDVDLGQSRSCRRRSKEDTRVDLDLGLPRSCRRSKGDGDYGCRRSKGDTRVDGDLGLHSEELRSVLLSRATQSLIVQELQRLHSKLDVLAAEQRQIAEAMGVMTESPILVPNAKANEEPHLLRAASDLTSDDNDAFDELGSIKVELREDLASSAAIRSTKSWSGKMRLPSTRTVDVQDRSTTLADMFAGNSRSKKAAMFPLQPNSRVVLSIEVVSIICLFYDSVMTPFFLAWNRKEEGFFWCAAWAIAFFWTFDLLLHFVRAFTIDDQVVADFKTIASKYLQRRFSIDLITVTFDWLGIIMEMTPDGAGGSSTKYVKFVRIIKISRLLRIIAVTRTGRLARFKDALMHQAYMLGIGAQIQFCANLVAVVVLLLWFNHIIGCMWIALESSSMKDTHQSWELKIAAMHDGTTFENAGLSMSFQYWIAYYWALSTMFSGGSFLVPMTTAESIFACGSLLFGVLVASSMISALATLLMDIHQATRDRRFKLQQLQRYLQQNKVEPMIRLMIHRQVLHRMTSITRVQENDVELIPLLSTKLRDCIRFGVWTPVLIVQPLWRACVYVDDQWIKNLCRYAVRCENFDPGAVIFEEGEIMEDSYILITGDMQYIRLKTFAAFVAFESEGSVGTAHFASAKTLVSEKTEDTIKETVVPNQQVCEIALWAKVWQTVGLMESVSPCELLVCSAKSLIEVVRSSNPQARETIRSYADAFLQLYQQKVTPSGRSDLSTSIDHDSIVTHMPQETRVLMSMPSLKALKRGKLGSSKVASLEREIYDGRTNLGQDESGTVLRVARLSLLRLKRSDEKMCINLGEFYRDKVKVELNLPGVKMAMQETWIESTDRLMNTYFVEIVARISRISHEVSVEVKSSVEYGIPTKYIRTLVIAHVDFPVEMVTREVHLEQQTVECFYSSSMDNGSCKFKVFAWMRQLEYEKVLSMGNEGKHLAEQWINDTLATICSI